MLRNEAQLDGYYADLNIVFCVLPVAERMKYTFEDYIPLTRSRTIRSLIRVREPY